MAAASTLPSFAQVDPRDVRKENFKGDIQLDVRNSKADWAPYTPKKAPKDAPKQGNGG